MLRAAGSTDLVDVGAEVHVFTDGDTGDYTVVPTTTFQIKNLSPGRHTIG